MTGAGQFAPHCPALARLAPRPRTVTHSRHSAHPGRAVPLAATMNLLNGAFNRLEGVERSVQQVHDRTPGSRPGTRPLPHSRHMRHKDHAAPIAHREPRTVRADAGPADASTTRRNLNLELQVQDTSRAATCAAGWPFLRIRSASRLGRTPGGPAIARARPGHPAWDVACPPGDR